MKKLVLIISLFFIGINVVNAKELVKFVNCVDGDTIKISLDNKDYTVRMLAVDTPESVHPSKGVEYYGKEASEYTCNIVKNAKKIELEYDPDSEKMDKYDRLLAWVFVDGELLQELLVKNGYAKIAYLYGDYKYTDKLERIQEEVSAKNIGIWNNDAKNEYDSNINNNNINDNVKKAYETKEIVVILILLLIIVFVSDKSIKKKAKKQLKNYLN